MKLSNVASLPRCEFLPTFVPALSGWVLSACVYPESRNTCSGAGSARPTATSGSLVLRVIWFVSPTETGDNSEA